MERDPRLVHEWMGAREEGAGMKILIAVDQSPHSERAVRFVTRMRWPAGSRVIVANAIVPVISPPLPSGGGGAPVAVEVSAEQRAEVQTVVAQAEDELRAAGIATESRFLTGDPRDALLRLAEDERVDLMVMGSHGRTGFAKLLLGSVSSHVVTHAHCSVLVVKEDLQEKS
jgi:nucleotide-binding universal stress UspA family protein